LIILIDRTEEIELAEYKTRMIGSISHNLRNPLYGIISLVEASQSFSTCEEHQKNIKMTLHFANILSTLLNDLLDYSQIQFDNFHLKYSIISLEKLVNDCISLIEFQAKNKGLNFLKEFEFEPNLEISTDINRFKNILYNILITSFNTTFHGYVKLNIKQQIINNSNVITFTISNTGKIFTKEESKSIFELFDHGKKTSLNILGVSLGLPISNYICTKLFRNRDLNGIKISESIEGSIFFFLF
jgi:signal transduction histidine kinase